VGPSQGGGFVTEGTDRPTKRSARRVDEAYIPPTLRVVRKRCFRRMKLVP